MNFKMLQNGEAFMCSGTEYVKISETQAFQLSPLVIHFSSSEQVIRSTRKSTTIGNWKFSDKEQLNDVRGGE